MKPVVVKPALAAYAGDTSPRQKPVQGQYYMMGDDPSLPIMPKRPTLIDFFKLRFQSSSVQHLLQSAQLARQQGLNEKIILACLLHDISVIGFLRSDHGYWGAQMIEPYVDEEVSWAVKYHQSLRFYPDLSVGYEYPEAYLRYFGPDYRPEPYIERDYEYARNHRWYMSARMITLNDIYSFDPNVTVDLGNFIDLIGSHFRQPRDGLGFDGSSAAHIWRTIIWPNNFL